MQTQPVALWPFPPQPPGTKLNYLWDLSGPLTVPAIPGVTTTYDPLSAITITVYQIGSSTAATDLTVSVGPNKETGVGGSNTAVGYQLSGGTKGVSYQVLYSWTTVSGQTNSMSTYLECAVV